MPGLDATLNIHPLFVHFPIALTLAAIPLMFYSMYSGKTGFMDTAAMMIYMAAISAVVTAATGLMASNALGHDAPGHDLVHAHRDLMYWYTGLITTLAAFNFFLRRDGAPDWASHWGTKAVRMTLLFSAVAIMTLGTDRGALLVFGHGIGGTYQAETGDHMEGEDAMKMDGQVKPAEDDHSDHEH